MTPRRFENALQLMRQIGGGGGKRVGQEGMNKGLDASYPQNKTEI